MLPYYKDKISKVTVSNHETCTSCERNFSDTCEPNYCVEMRDGYGIDQHLCLPCSLLYIGNGELLGTKVKGKVSIFIDKDDKSILDKIVSDDSKTLKEKQALAKKSVKSLTEAQFEKLIPSREVFINVGVSVFVKSSFVNTAKSIVDPNNTDNVKNKLEEMGALISKADHIKGLSEMSHMEYFISKGGSEELRLGLMAGLGIYADKNKLIMYGTGEHFQNFASRKSFPFELRPIGGNRMIFDALPEFNSVPALFINNMGNSQKNIIKNIQVSEYLDEFNICDSKGTTSINPKAFTLFYEYFSSLNKPLREDFSNAINKILCGFIPVSGMQELLSPFEGSIQLFSKLPKDPHEVLKIKNIVARALQES
jgi:hypothetical protein